MRDGAQCENCLVRSEEAAVVDAVEVRALSMLVRAGLVSEFEFSHGWTDVRCQANCET